MIILPTIYRPENLRRFIKCYQMTRATLPVYVVFDGAGDSQYQFVSLPAHFRRGTAPPGTAIGNIFNMAFRQFPDEAFYGILADDVLPATLYWDVKLRDACLPDRMTWGFDGGHDETLPRHPFIGGDLVRRLGYLAAPGVKHWYVDNAWRDIAQALDCGVYQPEVQMLHYHYTNGKAQKDRTYLQQPDPRADERAYNIWKEQALPAILKT